MGNRDRFIYLSSISAVMAGFGVGKLAPLAGWVPILAVALMLVLSGVFLGMGLKS
jgi:hypothetical protein